METYQVRQKVTDRTLTVELPEEFAGSEVKVIVSKEVAPAEMTKEERLATIQRFAGIYEPGDYVMPEDEWYKQ